MLWSLSNTNACACRIALSTELKWARARRDFGIEVYDERRGDWLGELVMQLLSLRELHLLQPLSPQLQLDVSLPQLC